MKVTILSNGHDLTVINSSTGETLDNVTRVQLAWEPGKLPHALIQLSCPELDVSELRASFTEISTNGNIRQVG